MNKSCTKGPVVTPVTVVTASPAPTPEYAQPDRLFGAKEIAAYLYGDPSKAKKVYNLCNRVRPPYRFPIYKLAGELVAKRSEIEAWFAQQQNELRHQA